MRGTRKAAVRKPYDAPRVSDRIRQTMARSSLLVSLPSASQSPASPSSEL